MTKKIQINEIGILSILIIICGILFAIFAIVIRVPNIIHNDFFSTSSN